MSNRKVYTEVIDSKKIINDIKSYTSNNDNNIIPYCITGLITSLKIKNYIPNFKRINYANLCYILALNYNDQDLNEYFNANKLIQYLNLFSEVNLIISVETIIDYYKKNLLSKYINFMIQESEKLKVVIPCYFYKNTIFFEQKDFIYNEKKITIYI